MTAPSGLEGISDRLRARFDAKNRAREAALTACRELIQLSAKSIRASHRRDPAEADALLGRAEEVAQGMRGRLADHPDLAAAGYVHDAMKEVVEARVVAAIVRGEPIPGPEAASAEPAAYLNGLAEAASECRRYVLDRLKEGELPEADRILAAMDAVYAELIAFDYPDALTGGLRRTTDALRPVLERTRGDVTIAFQQQALGAAIRDAMARLDR